MMMLPLIQPDPHKRAPVSRHGAHPKLERGILGPYICWRTRIGGGWVIQPNLDPIDVVDSIAKKAERESGVGWWKGPVDLRVQPGLTFPNDLECLD